MSNVQCPMLNKTSNFCGLRFIDGEYPEKRRQMKRFYFLDPVPGVSPRTEIISPLQGFLYQGLMVATRSKFSSA